jgi:hypothetical protein
MAEKDNEFWRRYPDRYVLANGAPLIYPSGMINACHEKYIDDDFFEFVGGTNRFPRYRNKRVIDPQVKCHMDREKLEYEPEWDLPVPNVDAAYKSLAKYAKTFVNMPQLEVQKMNLAWEWMSRHFSPYMCNSVVISLEEAVQHLDMTTASGCPFNKEFATKREVFEKDPAIMEWLANDWNRLAWDRMWTTIFSSSLKEELRPALKIVENSLRTFTAGAIDATVHGTRLFVNMNEKMYASHLVTASVIGMTPLKGNWEKLYQKLNVFPNGYALDESQYDSSLREFLMWGCGRFRFECLCREDQTPENLQRIQTYYRNLVNTLILSPDGILLMKKGGNPSGSVNTVTDNTLILYWIMCYAWISLAPKEYCTLAAFEEHTAKALLGDDNTWTVSDLAHGWYNGRSVIETWKIIGITTTTDSLEPRPACELDFLSAHTVFLRGRAVPLYNRNKLMQSLLYASRDHLTPEVSLTRVCCLLQIGWTDYPMRKYCRELINFLLEKYDKVLANDARWIIAKTNIKTDEFYARLVLGDGLLLQPQSYQETNKEKRLIKDFTMSLQKQTKTQRKPRSRRGPGPKKGKVTVRKTVIQQRKKRRTRTRKRGGALAGKGSTSMSSSGRTRFCVVEEDEYIGEIYSKDGTLTSNFLNQAFPLNPGQSATFPWLSKQAAQWEKYTFERLEFYYKREVSEFAPGGTTGKVILSVDYDASDAPPGTKQQMEDTIPHRDAMPCENMVLVLDKRSMHPSNMPKYVRPGGLPGASDIKTFDAGNFNVATQGITNPSLLEGVQVGELRVRYCVRFEIPILESNLTVPANNQVAVLFRDVTTDGSQVVPSAVSTVISWPSTVINGISALVDPLGNFALPSGNYRFDVSVECALATNFINSLQVTLYLGTSMIGHAHFAYATTAANCDVMTASFSAFASVPNNEGLNLQVLQVNGPLASTVMLVWGRLIISTV